MRPTSGFSGFTADPMKGSWEELSRDRDDGATKNYSVPPELIELARANRKARGQVGTLTPLAPKPAQEVVVVVPAAAPVARDMRASESVPAISLQAPSIPIPAEGASEPESAPTVVASSDYVARASSRPSAPAPALSPLAEIMRAELAVARGGSEPAAAQQSEERPVAALPVEAPVDEAQPAAPSEPSDSANVSQSTRRTSRRARRSSRIEMPAAVSAAARAVAATPVRSKNYVPVALGAVVVSAYVVLCYYANALLAGMP